MSTSDLSASTLDNALTMTALLSPVAGTVAWAAPFDAITIPAAVLFMAMTGTAAGLLWQPPDVNRRRLFALAFVYTAVAAAAAVVAPEFKQLTWIKPVAPAFALLLAFGCVTLLHTLLSALGQRIKRSVGGDK